MCLLKHLYYKQFSYFVASASAGELHDFVLVSSGSFFTICLCRLHDFYNKHTRVVAYKILVTCPTAADPIDQPSSHQTHTHTLSYPVYEIIYTLLFSYGNFYDYTEYTTAVISILRFHCIASQFCYILFSFRIRLESRKCCI